MAEAEAPLVQRALLTSELRRLRAFAHLRQEEAAKTLDWSLSKLIRIEGGTVGLSTTDLKALLQLYGVTDEVRIAELVELARLARTRGWWASYTHVHNQGYLNYVSYETSASIIRMAHGLLIPGLLQTPDYAWALTPEYAEGENEVVRNIVELRLDRQEQLFNRDKPPIQFYVLDEAVIRRRVGAPKDYDLMPAQLRHLVDHASQPNVTIEVIPFGAGVHLGLQGPFALLAFDGELGDVLYLESARRGDLTLADQANSPLIRRYHEAFEELRKLSLGPEESIKLIKQVAEEMPQRHRGSGRGRPQG